MKETSICINSIQVKNTRKLVLAVFMYILFNQCISSANDISNQAFFLRYRISVLLRTYYLYQISINSEKRCLKKIFSKCPIWLCKEKLHRLLQPRCLIYHNGFSILGRLFTIYYIYQILFTRVIRQYFIHCKYPLLMII